MPLAALSLSRAVTVFSSIKWDPRWSPFCLLCHKQYKPISLHHKTSCWSHTVQLGHKEQWQYFPQIHLLIPQRKPISLINDISGGNKIFIKLPNGSTVRFHFFNQQVTGQNCTFSPWSNLMEKRINYSLGLFFVSEDYLKCLNLLSHSVRSSETQKANGCGVGRHRVGAVGLLALSDTPAAPPQPGVPSQGCSASPPAAWGPVPSGFPLDSSLRPVSVRINNGSWISRFCSRIWGFACKLIERNLQK